MSSGTKPACSSGAALAVAFARRGRDRPHHALAHRACAAALVGGLAAGVAGALTDDSGPVLVIDAVIGLTAVTDSLLGRPKRPGERPAPADRPVA